jgi:hypothetical protein
LLHPEAALPGYWVTKFLGPVAIGGATYRLGALTDKPDEPFLAIYAASAIGCCCAAMPGLFHISRAMMRACSVISPASLPYRL